MTGLIPKKIDARFTTSMVVCVSIFRFLQQYSPAVRSLESTYTATLEPLGFSSLVTRVLPMRL